MFVGGEVYNKPERGGLVGKVILAVHASNNMDNFIQLLHCRVYNGGGETTIGFRQEDQLEKETSPNAVE